jgi:hypothetical protein
LLSIYDGDDYNVLEYIADEDHDFEEITKIDEDDFEVEDLTDALDVYNEKLSTKDNLESVLRSRKLIFQPSKRSEILINSFLI